ncbi:MAG: hypothetical protein IJ389_04680 [Clostridia bacterium]|nr:hypothetical protein [Clostridia bacterium]MBQ7836530.1 hypothetical protein [Clostridia bacterium]
MSTISLTQNDKELLCEINRNLDMTVESTTMVMKKVDNKELLTLLTEVVMKSGELSKKAHDLMHNYGIVPEEFTKMKQLSADFGIMMNTLFDSSDGHIAEMMVKGLEMGVVSMRQFTEENPPSDSKVAELCVELADFQSAYAHKIGNFARR